MEKSLEIINIYTGYSKFLLKNITLSLHKGDILGLVGRSGSGKSTLIQTIVGIKKQKKGKILIDNEINTKNPSKIGYSLQKNALFTHLTIWENLFTFGRMHSVKKQEILKRGKILLGKLNLLRAGNKKIYQLSGGMEKRADLAITLIHNPSLLSLYNYVY